MAVLTEEQTMLRDAAKDWTSEKAPVAALRALRDRGSDQGFDAATWRDMGQMGWAGVIVPEAYGGSDFGYRSLGLVLEETGRTLAASPLVSTALISASALTLGGSAAQKDAWLGKIAAAECVATLALEEHPHHGPERTALKAVQSDDSWTLTGAKVFVLDGMAADLFIVPARTSGHAGDAAGITLFLVPADAKGLARKRLHTVDSRGAADLTFDGVAVGADAVLGQVDHGFDLLDQVLDRARAGLAAEMVGSASQAFEITLDYLKTRTQFGQLIGTFQALQHRAAKMFTALEMTRSCVEAALDAIDGFDEKDRANDVRALCSLAKAKASDTLHLISNEMVQMHGGIGMTDAHDAGLYMKRARVAEALFGGASFHRDRYATLMGF
jgi:alkylation response protein AidB-like acyl-CoA dehydrogenase